MITTEETFKHGNITINTPPLGKHVETTIDTDNGIEIISNWDERAKEAFTALTESKEF